VQIYIKIFTISKNVNRGGRLNKKKGLKKRLVNSVVVGFGAKPQ
jgi:hypothetical protein